MKPGPKPLPAEARQICRVILNLYPAEFEQVAMVALWSASKPSDVVRRALRIALPIMAQMIDETFDHESA